MSIKGMDLREARFGRLCVVAFIESRKSGTRRSEKYWLCICDCGNKKEIAQQLLISGRCKSCGCFHKENLSQRTRKHGASGSKLYAVWKTMRQRCNNPNNPRYKYYGGRGIKICSRWNDFSAFNADMGDPPPAGTLDRQNNDGDYCPENCRWIEQVQQVRNRRCYRKRFEWEGESVTYAMLADRWRCTVEAAQARVRRKTKIRSG
jgi:hypothetical protein